MNVVTFHRSADRNGRTELMTARVVVPSGREISVTYHPTIDRVSLRSGLSLYPADLPEDGSPLWVTDRDGEDVFCSELFQELTGRFPYEVEESIPANRDFVPFVEGCKDGCVMKDDAFECEYCGRPM